MVDRNDFKATYAWKLDANLWYGLWKVRMKNSSIPKWKRWWFRIIIYTVTDTGVVRPLLIYSKSEYATITDREIQYALEKVIQEETNM
jgi:hypothetical protein